MIRVPQHRVARARTSLMPLRAALTFRRNGTTLQTAFILDTLLLGVPTISDLVAISLATLC